MTKHDRNDHIIQKRQEGWQVKEIAATFDLSEWQVWNILSQNDVDRQARNDRIIEMYKDGWSDQVVGDTFGLTRQQVYHIRQQRSIGPKDRQASPKRKPKIDAKALSPMHRLIGTRIRYNREFGLDKNLNEFALDVNLSVHKLSEIENGVRDATFSELQRISENLEMSINQLLDEKNEALSG